MNKFSKIISILVILTFFGLYGFYLLNLDKFIIISSDSMTPTIFPGDFIYFEFKNPKEIHADPINGDILVIKNFSYLYKNGVDQFSFRNLPADAPVIHRAIRKVYCESEQVFYFETRGDNAEWSDGCVKGNYSDGFGRFILNMSDPVLCSELEILGVVRIIIPRLGILGLNFSTIFFISMMIFVIISVLNKIFGNYKIIIKKI